jgi:methylated-DNA-[protein]-cysteine S-methyltransferase
VKKTELNQMEESKLLERITINPKIFGDKPIIRGHRLAVEHILGMLAAGDSSETILSGYPWLEAVDIQACLIYALRFTVFETEMGWLGIAGTSIGISKLTLPMRNRESAVKSITESNNPEIDSSEEAYFSDAIDSLKKYFKGQKVNFSLPLDLDEGTDFQRSIWEATKSIPYGELRSYGWVAQQIGNPKSARAVGQALGANPIPIIIPCHRVVASDGSLHGFTGGLHLKEKLIALEREKL